MKKASILLILLILSALTGLSQTNELDELNAKGEAYYEAGDYKKALNVFKKLLDRDKEANPDFFDLIENDSHWVAYMLHKLNRDDEAKTYNSQFYEITPVNRADIVKMNELSLNFSNAQSIDMALYWADRILQEEVKLYGENHFLVYGSHCALARIYYQMGNEWGCRKHVKPAKEIASQLQTTTTAWRAMPYAIEASLEMALNNPEACRPLFEQAWTYLNGDVLGWPDAYDLSLQLFIKFNFYDSPDFVNNEVSHVVDVITNCEADKRKNCVDIVRCINDYAIFTGQPQITLPLTEQLLSESDENNGQYPYLLFDYGRLLDLSKQHTKAANTLEQALEIMKKQYPKAPDQWVNILAALGACYDNLHEYKTAEQYIKESLKIYKKYSYYEGEIHSLHQLAALSTRTNSFDQAIEYLQECLQLMKRNGVAGKGDYAYIYKEMANCYGTKNPDKSLSCYKEAVNLLDNPVAPNEKETYLECKFAIMRAELSTDSIEDEAQSLIEMLGNDAYSTPHIKVRVYSFLANYFLEKMDYNKSLEYNDLTIKAGEGYSNIDLTEAYSMKSLNLVFLKRSDEAWQIADDLYNTTLQQYGKLSIKHIQAINIYQTLADNDLAFDRIEKLPEMAETLLEYCACLDKEDPAYIMYSITAAKCFGFSDPEKSKQIILKTLDSTKSINGEKLGSMPLYAYQMLSFIERNRGDLDKAKYYSNILYNNLQDIDDNDIMAYVTVCDEIGQTFLLAGRMKDAELVLLDAIKRIEDINSNVNQLVLLYDHLANVYNKMGHVSMATKYEAKRNALYNNWEDNDMINVQQLMRTLWIDYNSGLKEFCWGNIMEIENIVAKRGLIDQSIPDKLKAMYYYREGEYDKAVEYIEDVLQTNENLENLTIASEIYFAAAKFDKALETAGDLLAGVESYYRNNSMEYVAPYKRLGDIHLAIGNKSESLGNYRKCFDYSVKYIDDNLLTLTAKQRADFWTTNSYFYYTFLPYIAYTHNFPEGMTELLYDVALFSNGLLLTADKTIASIVDKTTPEIKSMYSSYLAKKEILKKLTENYNQEWLSKNYTKSDQANINFHKQKKDVEAVSEECEAIERSFMNELRTSYPQLLTYKTYKWRDVQKRLNSKSAAIEYLDFQTDTLNNTIAALVIRKDSKTPVFRTLMSYPRNKQFNNDELYKSTEMGDSLVSALYDLLDDCEDVYFSPKGLLNSIAVESLPRSEPSGAAKINLHRVSSTSILTSRTAKSNDYKAALFGGLNYNTSIDSLKIDAQKYPELHDRAFVSDNLFRAKREGDVDIDPLPGTLNEVNMITSLIESKRKDNSKLFIGNEGTETAFKALSGKYGNILHVSTHGFFNVDDIILNPNIDVLSYEDLALEQSGLLLAGASHRYVNGDTMPDDLDDGILKASEIAKLEMSDVDLVVLSACETGLGSITGDGVFGLQRGFKKAGANSILMSLWKVDDDATCALMNEFYKHWLSGKSKYESLELAKSHIKTQPSWSDPKYWAAFILLDGLN